MSTEIIRAEGLTKRFFLGKVTVEALRGTTLSVEEGEFCALMGPSGSGKSTLLHLLGLLDSPSEGRILYRGQDLRGFNDAQRSQFRLRRTGFVFQFFNLLPELTARENVMLRLMLAGHARPGERAAELLAGVDIPEDRFRHRPMELSGGQQQRVAIARALANEPEVLFLDEPTGNLDTEAGANIIRLLQRLNREGGQTIVMVTHDPQMAEGADRVLHMRDGRLLD